MIFILPRTRLHGEEKCKKQKHPDLRSKDQDTRVGLNAPFKAVQPGLQLKRARPTVRHYSQGSKEPWRVP